MPRSLVSPARRRFGLCAGSALLLPAHLARAESFPSRNVRLVSPYPSGSGADVAARTLAGRLQAGWGQNVLVDARPGANGFLAISAFKAAPPSGHDLLLADMGHLSIAPMAFSKLPYDPVADFLPVSLISIGPMFVAVGADSPFKKLGDLITAARSNGLTYASPGIGSFMQLGAEQFASAIGARMLHVPFRENSQLTTAVVTSEVSWVLATMASVSAMVKAGRMRLLAVAGPTRVAIAPEVPTLQEAGGPPITVSAWLALLALAGTPRTVVDQINAALGRALDSPDLKERFAALGIAAAHSKPEDLARLVQTERIRYGDIIQRAGIRLD
jgi:tripartite-type tricarboxylate transporter receptor subunit TctC